MRASLRRAPPYGAGGVPQTLGKSGQGRGPAQPLQTGPALGRPPPCWRPWACARGAAWAPAPPATGLWSFLCRLRRIVRLRSCGIGNRSIALVLLSGFGTSRPGLARGLLGSGLFIYRLRCGCRALCHRGLLYRRGHRITSGLHLRHTSRCGRGSLNLLASFNLAGRRCGRLHGLGLVIV